MRKTKLVTTNQTLLYEGYHPTLNEAIEFAIAQGISLNHIDLSYKNIQHINLDGVTLHGASFKGANLNGANMSESEFLLCDFSDSDMTNACLCYSKIDRCNFKYAIFSETDISISTLEFSEFQGFSSLQLNFHKAFVLQSLTLTHFDKTYPFSAPPTLIHSAGHQVAILDKVLVYKDDAHTFEHKIPPKSIDYPSSQKIQSIVDLIKKIS